MKLFHDQISMKDMWPDRGSNPRPPEYQSEHPTNYDITCETGTQQIIKSLVLDHNALFYKENILIKCLGQVHN